MIYTTAESGNSQNTTGYDNDKWGLGLHVNDMLSGVLHFLMGLISTTVIMFQVKEVALAARKRNARLSFAFVYPDKNGRFVVKQVRVHSLCDYLSFLL